MCMRVIIQSISHWLSWIQFSMTFFCLSNSLAVSRKFVIVYLPLWFTLDDMKKRFQSVEIAEVSEEEGVLVNIELLIILGMDCVQNITDFLHFFYSGMCYLFGKFIMSVKSCLYESFELFFSQIFCHHIYAPLNYQVYNNVQRNLA